MLIAVFKGKCIYPFEIAMIVIHDQRNDKTPQATTAFERVSTVIKYGESTAIKYA